MPEESNEEPYYRTGNKNPRNIYLVVPGTTIGDEPPDQPAEPPTELHVGCVFDPTDGPYLVQALNIGLAVIRAGEQPADHPPKEG